MNPARGRARSIDDREETRERAMPDLDPIPDAESGARTNHVIAFRPTAEASDDVVFDHLRLGIPELEEISNSRCPRGGVVVAE